jgi:hypothetical protein
VYYHFSCWPPQGIALHKNIITWLWSVGIQCLFKINESMCSHTNEEVRTYCAWYSRWSTKLNCFVLYLWNNHTSRGPKPILKDQHYIVLASAQMYKSMNKISQCHPWSYLGNSYHIQVLKCNMTCIEVGFKKPASWTWVAKQRIIRTCTFASRRYLW